LVVYVEDVPEGAKPAHINSKGKETKKKSGLYHDSIPLGKTFYKVLRG